MPNFLTLKPTAFGLDISDVSLKIAQLKKRGRFFDLVSFGETRMKPGIIDQGEIKDEKALAENIKKAISEVKGEKIRTKYVVISLPEEKAFLQVIQLPPMEEGEVKKAVYFEAENYIPMPPDKVYLDSQIVSREPKSNKLNVLIAAQPKTVIDPYVNSFKKAGLKPLALEIESMSISRSLVREDETHSPLILVDLGENRTSFSIFFEHSLRFTTTAQLAAKKLTEAIAQELKVDFKEAEALKLKNGIADTKMGKKIAEILKPDLTELAELAQKYIDYCQTEYDQKVSRVLLCGGGANLKGLVDLLSRRLKVTVEAGNPWINISPSFRGTNQWSHEESLRYATALGLALRGARP